MVQINQFLKNKKLSGIHFNVASFFLKIQFQISKRIFKIKFQFFNSFLYKLLMYFVLDSYFLRDKS